MKLKTVLLLLLIGLTACDTGGTGFSIEGAVTNIEGEIHLSIVDNNQLPTSIDKTTIEDGTFRFVGVLDEPTLVKISQFVEGRRNDLCNIFMGNEKIKIKLAKDEKGRLSTYFSTSKYGIEKATFESEIHKVGNYEQQEAAITTFISEHPRSALSAYVLYMAYKLDLPTSKLYELSSLLKGDAQNSMYTKMAMEGASNLDKTAIGNKFTDFTLPNFSDTSVSLSSVAGKGDWVILYFWDTYAQSMSCNGYMKDVEEKYKSKGLKIFAVSLDDLKSAWINAAITLGDNEWIHVSDLTGRDCEVAKTYNVTNVPEAILIAPDGTIEAYFDLSDIPTLTNKLSTFIK